MPLWGTEDTLEGKPKIHGRSLLAAVQAPGVVDPRTGIYATTAGWVQAGVGRTGKNIMPEVLVAIRGLTTRTGAAGTADAGFGAAAHVAADITSFNWNISTWDVSAGGTLSVTVNYNEEIQHTNRYRHIDKNKIPSMIDEIPILSLVCAYVEGESVISGLEELRYKESDRLKGICDILEGMGAKATLHNKDQIRIKGENKLYNTNKLPDLNDHRLAMMISIAQIVSGNSVSYPDCINVSFPDFKNLIEEILEA